MRGESVANKEPLKIDVFAHISIDYSDSQPPRPISGFTSPPGEYIKPSIYLHSPCGSAFLIANEKANKVKGG